MWKRVHFRKGCMFYPLHVITETGSGTDSECGVAVELWRLDIVLSSTREGASASVASLMQFGHQSQKLLSSHLRLGHALRSHKLRAAHGPSTADSSPPLPGYVTARVRSPRPLRPEGSARTRARQASHLFFARTGPASTAAGARTRSQAAAGVGVQSCTGEAEGVLHIRLIT